MRSISTAVALVALLLVGDALAGPHQRHQHLHNKKRDVTVTDVWDTTVTVTDVVTVGWPPASSSAVAPTTPSPAQAAATESPEPAILLEKPAASPSTSSDALFRPTPSKSTGKVRPTPSKFTLLNNDVNIPSVSSAAPTTLATSVKPSTTPGVAATSTTAAPAASSSKPSSSGGSGGLQRGVPYNDASLVAPFLGSGSQITWCYNWGNSPSGAPSGIEFVPMLWGLGSQFTSAWHSAVTTAIAAGSKHCLGNNEPDLASQANLSPQDAATGWQTYMQPYAGQIKLGSPAVTNGGAPMGPTWMKTFIEACEGCTVDFCNFHFYDAATNIDYFKSFVQDAYQSCGGSRPIWITECGLTGSDDQIIQWIEEVIPWLESLGYVERIAYFMAQDGLLNSGSGLSAYGQTWVTFTS